MDWGKKALYFSPFLLAIFVMLPRLLSPNFGFFDDALSLSRAREIWAGQWLPINEMGAGRFRPLYWFYYAFLYRLFGVHPLGYFIGNLVLFLILVFCVILLARALGVDRKLAWLVGVALALAGPVLENIYTLNKLELLQSVLIIILLLFGGLYARIKTRLWKLVILAIMVCLAFLACMTKETGILLVPAALISLAVHWLWAKLTHQTERSALYSRFTLCWTSLVGVIAYLVVGSLLKHALVIVNGSSNLNFNPGWLYSQFRVLVDWMIRDYLYLVPLGLGAILALFKNSNRRYVPILLESIGWILIWVAVYFPWLYLPEYYLLPVALILAVLYGIMISLNLDLFSSGRLGRILAGTTLSVSSVLFILTIPNQVTNGHLQIVMDRANAEMLSYVVDKAPQRSTILINIQEPNEYVDEFVLWVNQLNNRPDLQVDYFHDQDLVSAKASGKNIWIVSPYIENQFYQSVRLGIQEHTSKLWIKDLEGYLNGKSEQIADIRYGFQIMIIDPMRFFCPLADSISYCRVPSNPLDHRILAYGWLIDRLP